MDEVINNTVGSNQREVKKFHFGKYKKFHFPKYKKGFFFEKIEEIFSEWVFFKEKI